MILNRRTVVRGMMAGVLSIGAPLAVEGESLSAPEECNFRIRVLFGSHSPFYYFESTLLKDRESDLSAVQKEALTDGNARRLLSS